MNPFLLKSFIFLRKPLIYTLAVLLIFGAGYFKGDSDRQIKEAKKETTKIERGIERHAKVQKKVMSLSDIELRKSYCKWVRDDKAKCLKSDIPISE